MKYNGLTIESAINKIKKIESKNEIYQIYVIERKIVKKDFKKVYKKYHLYNKDHKRIYYKTESLYYIYAQKNDLENQKIIIDSFIEVGHHSYLSLSGKASQDYTHNMYYLVVEHLEKTNKGKPHLINTKKTEIEYKEGELTPKQRRFTL